MPGRSDIKRASRVGWRELLLLVISVTATFLAMEFVVRHTALGDQMGWSMIPPVAQRAEEAIEHPKEGARIVALGDSFTMWRDTTGNSFIRAAQRRLADVDVVNLGEDGTGLPQYYSNLLRYGAKLKPDIVVIGLYLGNDLTASSPPLDSDAARTLRPRDSPRSNSWKDFAKQSVLLNYIFRLAKVYVPPLRSDFLATTIARLKKQTGKDDAFVDERLRAADPRLVDAARADVINVWDLAFALFYPNYYGALAPGNQDTEAALKDLQTIVATVRSEKATPVVVLLPPPVWIAERYRSYFKRLGYGELGPWQEPVPLVERVKAYLREHGVLALDTLPFLRAATEAVYLDNDIHLNSLGQKLVGEHLAQLLIDHKLARNR